ncbi:MAG TPA: hypothetical protein VGD08_15875 [Stellaceae bacterium]|jgi:hypothetical protein
MIHRPHLTALALAGAVLVLWGAVMAMTLRAAAVSDENGGNLLTLFPPSLPGDRQIAAIVDAGGLPLRRTWLPNAWVVHSPGPGFVARLKDQGALGAFAEFPFVAEMAGCTAYIPSDRDVRTMRAVLR